MKLMLLVVLLALAGCKTLPPPPDAPKVVTVTVDRYIPLPEWATKPLPQDRPKAHTPEEATRLSVSRLETIRYANCRSKLLQKLDSGEPVSPKDCD